MKLSREAVERVAKYGKELTRDTTTPDIERIAGMFPRGFISIVASMAGTGKTWLTEYIACQLSVGGKILGGIVAKSPKYKTVIMSGETGTFLLDKRLGKTVWEYNPDKIRVYSATEMLLDNCPCMLNTPEGQETIITICAHEKPDIIFFDTLISFHTLDESKQGEMTTLYTFLLRLASVFNCAVVVNHHTRKRPANFAGKKFTQDDIIGTSAGVRLCSAAFIIMAEDNGEGGSKMTVYNPKNWEKKVPEFSYEFVEDDNGLIDFKIAFDTSTKNLFWSTGERFAELVKSYERGTILKVSDVARELGTTPEAMRYYVEKAVKNGLLSRTKLMNEVSYKVL